MAFALGSLGQVGLSVENADAAEEFFGGKLGLRKLFRFGTIVFYDMGGVRLMLEQAAAGATPDRGSPLYFKVADIALARRELEGRGVRFIDEIHLTAPMEDHDLWMSFFEDPDGHQIALMSEAPKGWRPGGGG